jgi:hypothetical protein
MGCCLTKKTRTRNKGLNETLLGGEGDESSRANHARGNRNGYTPVQIPGDDSRQNHVNSSGVGLTAQRFDRVASSGACIEGLDTVGQVKPTNTRKVVGTSLLVLPSIKSLKKVGWLQKRGHMVRKEKRG